MSLLSSLFCRLTPVVSLLMLATSLAAMPAHPDVVLRHARQGTLDRLAARSRTLHMRTLDQTRTREALPGRIFPSSGTRRIPILVIGYSDVNLRPASSQTFYNNLFNGSTLTPLSMKKYFADMSGNTLDLAIDVHMVGKAANTAAYYGQNINDFDAKPASLVGEAIDKAEAAGINWALYDNDNDGKVDVVMVIHARPGEEFSDVANHIWSHAWSLTGGKNNGDGTGPRTYDDKTIDAYTIQPEYNDLAGDSTIGVFCHEFVHKLGLPDLYDTTYATQGVGQFSLMANGAWLGPGKNGSRPAPLLAWERHILGWVQLTDAPASGTLTTRSGYQPSFTAQHQGGTASGQADAADSSDIPLILTVCVILISRRLRRSAGRISLSLLCLFSAGLGGCSDDEEPLPRASASYQVSLSDIESSRTALAIPLGDTANKQGYIVENKQRISGTWTEYLPGSGLLITRIHQEVYNATVGYNTVNDGANRIHGVTIVEADNDNMLWKGRDLAAGTVEYSDSGRQEDLFVSRSFTAETRPASFWHTASAAPWSSSGTRLSAAGLSSISPSGSVMSFICHVP